MPHVGTHVPEDIAAALTEEALALPDTDWHVDRLYDFLDDLGASIIAATHSRYVVDLNRAPDGSDLYPGQDTTELCPTSGFFREPLYREARLPDQDEIARRVSARWQPYHTALAAELERLKAMHGVALLWDAHSIASEVPRFFSGRLPDLNLGTNRGASCDPDLANSVLSVAEAAPGYSAVLDGRFTGGYITRHYGRPAEGVHAIQLELSQRTYMAEGAPFTFRDDLAAALRPALRAMLEAVLDWARKSRA
ncbi:MAG: N-formylglutamate deformylase [Rhodospirillales bacterium]|nr:MAG: N-formylglutamate deformylase [Rhodospirillales bacterium]